MSAEQGPARFKNGDPVMQNCIFCNAPLEPAGTLGARVKCPEPECGYIFKVTVYDDTPAAIRKPDGE